MSGAPEPLYIIAREVLLDGLEAIGEHRHAAILVGAQAIYLHTGDGDLALAPYTTDADVTLDPNKLGPTPLIEEALTGRGFTAGSQPGIWVTSRTVEDKRVDVGFDLLVPDSLGGSGSRGARLPIHGNRVARKARGLEAALVDHAPMTVSSLTQSGRTSQILVAGPSALLVAKLHKLGEREKTPERLKPKDAHDILRLLRAVPTELFAATLTTLCAHDLSGTSTSEALLHLRTLFAETTAIGPTLAARATAELESADVVTASCVALANDLLDALVK